MFKRIVHEGLEKFLRDKSSSLSVVLVLGAVGAALAFLFFLHGASAFAVSNLQNAVGVSAYFKEDTPEDDIAKLRAQLLTLPEVKSAEYVSKDAAYEQFLSRHQQDQTIVAALDAIGGNPFLASLHIRAQDPKQYAKIAEFLSQEPFTQLIDRVDYQDRQATIDKVSHLADGIQIGVFLVSAFLVFLSLLVAFNTIRLTILNSKEEIEIARLVGASNWFIEGPFFAQGAIAGFLSAALLLLLSVAGVLVLHSQFQAFLSGFRVAEYFLQNLWIFMLLQFGVGVGIGVISSMFAIRKYLRT